MKETREYEIAWWWTDRAVEESLALAEQETAMRERIMDEEIMIACDLEDEAN